MNPFDFNTQFDLWQFVGLAGAPTIQQFVQYLKVEWKLPTPLTPVVAIGFGSLFNLGLAFFLGNDLGQAIMVGILTGAFSNGWHEIAKKQ